MRSKLDCAAQVVQLAETEVLNHPNSSCSAAERLNQQSAVSTQQPHTGIGIDRGEDTERLSEGEL